MTLDKEFFRLSCTRCVGLEERITAPASRRAPCCQVNFSELNTAFISSDYFFTIDLLYLFSFGVNMEKKRLIQYVVFSHRSGLDVYNGLIKKLQTAKTVKDFGSSSS